MSTTQDKQDSTEATDSKAEDSTPAVGDLPLEEEIPSKAALGKTAPEPSPLKKLLGSTWVWVLGIFVILSVELYIYGYNGDIRVCVGVESLTDYGLRDEPRTQANAKHHPFCAERLNLGMWSSSAEQAQAALEDACSAAARVVGQERRQHCLRRDEPWTRFVEKHHVMPWDSRLYRRLLWLD